MKISIYNFKSISSVISYELKPLTILSGTNSSGKSSFIQLLLLLKQTLALDSSKHPLYLSGELYNAQDYKDIVRDKNIMNPIRVVFEISKAEFHTNAITNSIYDSFDDYTCTCDISFTGFNQEVIVSEFSLKYQLKNDSQSSDQFIRFWNRPNEIIPFQIESNNDYFAKRIWQSNPIVTSISFASFFPSAYEIEETVETDAPKQGQKLVDINKFRELPNLDSIKSYLVKFFDELFYVGPLRVEPRDEYSFKRDFENVGKEGENVALVLEKYGTTKIEVFIPSKTSEDTLLFELKNISLIEATSFWLCDVFKFGKDIFVKRTGDSYSIFLTTHNGLDTTIKHVGFGISQVLPIIVQGLLIPKRAYLILEQPEIHLHPKIQSALFDFLHSLQLAEKRVLVETHSDHMITRMRRRVAEDDTGQFKDKIQLTFVETTKNNLLFRNIDLDDFGALEYFPDDFIEKSDAELKAIVKAQMKKRLNLNKKS